MVAMLIGCGLRRAELLALDLESIQSREEHWVIADLVGKGGHVRTVPIPAWVKHHVDAWTAAAAITHGPVFRAINKAGRSGATACRRRCCGTSCAPPPLGPASTSWHPTTSDARVPVCAISRVANWTRFSSCSGTSRFRRQSATSDASRSSGLPLTTDWESNPTSRDANRRQGGCFSPPCATSLDLSGGTPNCRRSLQSGGRGRFTYLPRA